MKIRLFLIALFFYTVATLNAQVLVQKIPDENLSETDIGFIQAGFKLAYSNMTSEEYVFKGRDEEWKKCWIDLMQALNLYMQKKGLKLTGRNACFNRIYFSKEGAIVAYLYRLNGFTPAQEKVFDEQIFNFLIEQKVPIKTEWNYWQYGTLRFE